MCGARGKLVVEAAGVKSRGRGGDSVGVWDEDMRCRLRGSGGALVGGGC